MVRDGLDGIVLLHHGQHTFRFAKGEVQQLLDQEGDEDDPFLESWPTDRLSSLPVRELIGMESDDLHGQSETVDGQVIIPIEVYRNLLERNREGVKVHLARKIEYRTWHLYCCGCQIVSILSSWYMVTATHIYFGINIENKE